MEQRELITRLAAGEAFGGEPPERIDTHISVVFLAGDRAYKLKRALATTYLDYRDIEARKRGSEREVALNRRTAPELYIQAVPVTVDSHDRLAIGGNGVPLDWLVEMQRFDPGETFDALIGETGLGCTLLIQLADACAELHRSARVIEHGDFQAILASVISGNCKELAAAGNRVFSPVEIETLTARHNELFQKLMPIMDRRAKDSRVRECHGDLHLGNICLFRGRPLIFDAIEFNEDLNRTDTLYDIGFLLMDLIAHDQRHAANTVFNRYLSRNPDFDGIRVLPLYQSVRAAIRAHVLAKSALQTVDKSTETLLTVRARRYLDVARTLLEETAPQMIAVGGYSGTGKSTLAGGIAPLIGTPPGAVVLSSDLLRKRIYDVEPDQRLGVHLYRPEINDRIYAELRDSADRLLSEGMSVILDATFMQEPGRTAIEQLATSRQVAFHGYWLTGDPVELSRRVAERPQGASDATPDVLKQQLASDPGKVTWRTIDTTDTATGVVDLVRHDLQLMEMSR